MSDDGQYGLTLIAFVGSVFSPYYAWARRRGGGDPDDHCAINVALYGRRASRWAMTERGAAQVRREASMLTVGSSSMCWSGDALEIRIDERCAPFPRRIRGTVRLVPNSMFDRGYELDAAGLHRWTPFAPCARVEVAFTEPDSNWSGAGYFDANCGDEPLERTFRDWTWSRAGSRDSTVVLYDVNPRGADARSLALRFGAGNRIENIEAPPPIDLPTTGWRLGRRTRADAGTEARVIDTLEDAPFYSRTVLDTRVLGVRAAAIHESLDLDRFRAPWVQCLLPFRMPRITF